MDSMLFAVGSALWLGIMTSISPCPLATNIAAISYVGKRVDRPGLVMLSGLLYCGRMLSYSRGAGCREKPVFNACGIDVPSAQHEPGTWASPAAGRHPAA